MFYENQAYIFVMFILIGILIGLIFDIFRVSRQFFKTSNIITYIEDAVFWILIGLVLFISIFKLNNGELRAYIFLGVVLRNIHIYSTI